MKGICAVLWLTLALIPQAARGQAQESSDSPGADSVLSIESMRLGFEGVYKVGHWTPLAITLRSTQPVAVSGELFVEVVDGDGTSTLVHEPGISLGPHEKTEVHTLIKPGRPQAPVNIRFESARGVVARTFTQDVVPVALLATQELFVEIGGRIGLERLRQFYAEASLDRPAAAFVNDPAALPGSWLGYDGVDVVALTTSQLDLSSISPHASQALEEWVRQGGHLIYCVGRNGGKLKPGADPPAGAGRPWLRFLPGPVERVATRDPGHWESFAAAATEPMPRSEDGKMIPIPTTHLSNVLGRVELSDGVPLVVRTPYGLGEVLFVAADLDQPPFADWSARTRLLLRLLNRSEASNATSASRESNVQSIRLGYTDLSGQLRAALSQYDGARMTPFWLVFLLALAYGAALFPLEYALARWLRPRFEAAWVLLPCVLAASAVGVWYIALRWKGDKSLVNKVEVVDVDLTSGTLRGHAWLGLYSPREDAYKLSLVPAHGVPAPQLSWLGLAGGGLGGMNSQLGGLEPFQRGYVFHPSGSLDDVPLAAWSSKTFEASWQSSLGSSAARLSERSSDQQPLGRFQNNTGVPLRDCVLFYAGWSYLLGTLEPGASVAVGRNPRLLTVRSYLTERRVVGDKEQATPYEPDGAELRRIVRAILFHEAAGGRQYTSLSNRIYNRLDLSSHLRLDRAVLLASGPPATEATIAGRQSEPPVIEQNLTLYRFVIPVKRGGDGDEPSATVELRLQ